MNAFLVPKKSSDNSLQKFEKVGEACLDLMQIQNYAFKSKLPPIQIVELEPEFVYENYLSGAKITKEATKLLEKKNDAVPLDKKEGFLKVAKAPLNSAIRISNIADSNATYNTTHNH